jgi:tRNA pseudouridine13 synthase
MKQPTDAPAERVARVLTDAGLTPDHFQAFPQHLSGTRRPLLIWPQALNVTAEPEGLRFEFALPSGVYATTLLREFIKPE